jgi:hypothetical protein
MAAQDRDPRRTGHYQAADDAIRCLDPNVGVWAVFK